MYLLVSGVITIESGGSSGNHRENSKKLEHDEMLLNGMFVLDVS